MSQIWPDQAWRDRHRILSGCSRSFCCHLDGFVEDLILVHEQRIFSKIRSTSVDCATLAEQKDMRVVPYVFWTAP